MKITKRNGKKENIKFDKVLARIKKQTYGLDSKFIEPVEVAQKVISGLYDGVTSKEVDALASETAASMTVKHPDYSILASRIAITSLYKETDKSFTNTIKKLHDYVDPKTGLSAGLVNDDVYNFIMDNADEINSAIITDRDFLIDYFGFKTLERAYLLKIDGKIVETPQFMWMRVACGIWYGDIEQVIKTYDLMSQKYMTHATPTLFNAGTKRPQLSSCFLVGMKEDSIKGIYETLTDIAQISKNAGGIGLHVHNVRGSGAYIKGTNGISNGLVPMLRVFNETARYVDQGGGRRKGSFAIYLEPWHSDIYDFLDLRKNHGKEEQRTRDLFTALWIPDLFMEKVNEDDEWHLFSPDEAPGLDDVVGDDFVELYNKYVQEGKFRKVIKARDLWDKILDSQMETGTPYMLAKDAANLKSNQQNLGVIKSSNLCVAPETQILTSSGYQTISGLEGETVEVWNGKEWSETKVIKTGENQKLIKINFSNGQSLECTEYHKFYVQRGYDRGTGINKLIIEEKRASELVAGDKLIKYDLPFIDFENELEDAYTQGFFTGDGCEYKGKNHIDLYGEKILLTKHLKGNLVGTYSEVQDKHRFSVDNKYKKFFVPFEYSLNSKIRWLEGLFDADGVVCRNGSNESLQLTSINHTFIKNLHLMLQTIGVDSKIGKVFDAGFRKMPDGKGGLADYFCKDSYRIVISSSSLSILKSYEFSPNRLKISDHEPNRNAQQFIKVLSIEDNNRYDDTYCVNEPKEHKVLFNGVLTGNCTEIIEYSDDKEQAVCNLASIALPMYIDMKRKDIDYQKLYDVTYQATVNLNRVIDINYYPTEGTRLSNMKHRPIGLGIQGLADVFAKLNLPFYSDEAKDINKKISETMYFAAMTASKDLAIKYSPYETFNGSPLSKGIFQFDMWTDNTISNQKTEDGKSKTVISDRNPIKLSDMWDWESLRKEVMEHGVRNSLLVSPMPTASTANILGNNEAFEPFTSNIYKRNTLSGEFVMVNKHLVNDLIKLNLWNDQIRNKIIMSEGSIQNIDEIPQNVKDIYKTVWEIKLRDQIDMSADRGAFICQSQSFNLHVSDINKAKITTALMYGWRKGLKTLSYYIRGKSITSARKDLGIDNIKNDIPTKQQIDNIACSLDDPDDCIACSA